MVLGKGKDDILYIDGIPKIFNENYFAIYLPKYNRKETIDCLYNNALAMLRKSKICNYIDEALAIYNILERLGFLDPEIEKDFSSKEYQDEIILNHILVNYMNMMIDELFIISGMELYCSAILLEKGYVAHRIKGNKSLCNQQKKRPIKIDELSEINKETIEDKTVNFKIILENKNYIELLELANISSYKEMLERRNQIHFHLMNIGNVKKDYLLAVFQLFNKLLEKTNEYSEEKMLIDDPFRQKIARVSKQK